MLLWPKFGIGLPIKIFHFLFLSNFWKIYSIVFIEFFFTKRKTLFLLNKYTEVLGGRKVWL